MENSCDELVLVGDLLEPWLAHGPGGAPAPGPLGALWISRWLQPRQALQPPQAQSHAHACPGGLKRLSIGFGRWSRSQCPQPGDSGDRDRGWFPWCWGDPCRPGHRRGQSTGPRADQCCFDLVHRCLRGHGRGLYARAGGIRSLPRSACTQPTRTPDPCLRVNPPFGA